MVAAPLELETSDPDETRSLAAALARCCRAGDLVLLAGDLGAGKTTFAQGFAAGLGITEAVTSPTFTLVRQYPVPPGEGAVRVLLHADVYRLDHLAEVGDLGLGELVDDGGLALVEWGDVVRPVLGGDALSVRLSAPGGGAAVDRRAITVSSTGTTWCDRWAAVEAALGRWGRSS